LEEKGEPFRTYKELREDLERFIAKCKSENFAMNSQHMQWSRSQNELDHKLSNTNYAKKQR
jgi:hypothetical protein